MKEQRTTEEEIEGPTSSWESRNRNSLILHEQDDDDDDDDDYDKYYICIFLWSMSHDGYKAKTCSMIIRRRGFTINAKFCFSVSLLTIQIMFNPLNPEWNPICSLLALLGAQHFFHVSRIRFQLLTFRLLMSYIYGAPILDVSRSHTTTQHSR